MQERSQEGHLPHAEVWLVGFKMCSGDPFRSNGGETERVAGASGHEVLGSWLLRISHIRASLTTHCLPTEAMRGR